MSSLSYSTLYSQCGKIVRRADAGHFFLLSKKHFSVVSKLLAQEGGKEEFIAAVNAVRLELNPNPAGQDHNVPMLGDIRLKGIQHK